jgi:hypothetical protein
MAAGFAYAAYMYLSLPDVRVLRTENPGWTAFMRLREREAHAQGKPAVKDQRWVPYARISQNLKRAVIVTEDSAYWQHDGVDYDQLRESMETNLERGEFARGASTITQQLAKNLYLDPVKNPLRKLKELLITRRQWAVGAHPWIYLNVIDGATASGRGSGGAPPSKVGRRAHPSECDARPPPHAIRASWIRASVGAAAPAPADDHAADGGRHPAAGRGRARPGARPRCARAAHFPRCRGAFITSGRPGCPFDCARPWGARRTGAALTFLPVPGL